MVRSIDLNWCQKIFATSKNDFSYLKKIPVKLCFRDEMSFIDQSSLALEAELFGART